MTNREKLQENYEDSVLALLMDEFAESEGKRYIKENERLRRAPSAAVPEEIETRALRLIDREFSRKNRVCTGGKLLRFLGRLAIAAVIAALLFGAAFALSETVRAGTLNFLMQMDERIATWQFVEDEGTEPDGLNGVPEIIVDWIPEGYERQPQMVTGPSDFVLDCTNDAGGLIRVSVHESDDSIYTLNLEDSDYYSEIPVQNCDGILINKDSIIRIYWSYKDTGLVASVESPDIDADTLIHVAESVSILE